MYKLKTFKLCLVMAGLLLLTTCQAFADDVYEWVDMGWTRIAPHYTSAYGPYAGFWSTTTANPVEVKTWGGNEPGSQGPFEYAFDSDDYEHSYVLMCNGVPASTNPGLSITVTFYGTISITSDAYGSGSGSITANSGPTGATLGSVSSPGSVSGVYGSGSTIVGYWSSSTAVTATFRFTVSSSATGDGIALSSIFAQMVSP